MAIREKAKSLTEDVRELHSKVTRNMKKTIKPTPRSLLIIRHCTDGEPTYYFVQNVDELPINLRKAIYKLHGFVLNVSDWTPPLEKAWAYVSAALTQDVKYLDKSNAHDANRFAQKLLPYMLEQGDDPFVLMPSINGLDVVSFGECL